METDYGLDTSRYQGQITLADVDAAIADGKKFWYFKGSGGDDGLYVDSQFQNTFDLLRKAPLKLGVYHFAGLTDPIAEANYAVDNCWSGLETGELAILDVDTANPADPAWAKQFLDTATPRLGFKPVIYMNQNTENSYDWSPMVNENYGLIIANYAVAPDGNVGLKHWPFYFGQQYSSTGTVGSLHPVDLDAIFVTSIADWDKYGKPAPVASPVIPTPPVPVDNPDGSTTIPVIVKPPAPVEPPIEPSVPTPAPGTVVTPTSPIPPAVPTPSGGSEINRIDKDVTMFLSHYNKFLVALAGVFISWLLARYGTDPIVKDAVYVLTALGVYQAPNTSN